MSTIIDIGQLHEGNPSPFMQPFLVLRTGEWATDEWIVDVAGMIEKYLNPGPNDKKASHFDRKDDATPILKQMCRDLAQQGIHVTRVGAYVGSAGPSHLLRHGVFFKRMKQEHDIVKVKPSWMDEE